MTNKRLVFDTNVLLDFACFQRSYGARAVRLAIEKGFDIVFTKPTYDEAKDVLTRKRFERYQPLEARVSILQGLQAIGLLQPVTVEVKACRDPKDDKFLSAALSSGSVLIVSRDDDLLVMNPYKGVEIIDAREFLSRHVTDL